MLKKTISAAGTKKSLHHREGFNQHFGAAIRRFQSAHRHRFRVFLFGVGFVDADSENSD